VRPGRLSDTKVLQYWITVQDILPEYPGYGNFYMNAVEVRTYGLTHLLTKQIFSI